MAKLFLTPPSLPLDNQCRTLKIPGSKEWLGIFNAALLQMIYEWNWEQVNDTDLTIAECTAYCYDLFEEFIASGSECNVLERLYWEDEQAEDADSDPDVYPWYEQVADWVVQGFLAVSFSPGAAALHQTFIPRIRIAFRQQDLGALFRVLIGGIEALSGDTYAPALGMSEYDVDVAAFALANGLGAAPWDIKIEHVARPGGSPPGERLEIIRKRLKADEVDAITDIRLTGGQLQIQRGSNPTWVDVPTGEVLRRDGSIPVDGSLEIYNTATNETALSISSASASTTPHLSVLNGGTGESLLALTSAGRLAVGQTPVAAAARLHVRESNLGTSSENREVAIFERDRVGAASSGFGAFMAIRARTSTSMQEIARYNAWWDVATAASRRGALSIEVADASTRRVALAAGTDGTQPLIGFLGAPPVSRPVVSGSALGNGALFGLLEALAAYGLIVNSASLGTPIEGACDCVDEDLCRVAVGVVDLWYVKYREYLSALLVYHGSLPLEDSLLPLYTLFALSEDETGFYYVTSQIWAKETSSPGAVAGMIAFLDDEVKEAQNAMYCALTGYVYIDQERRDKYIDLLYGLVSTLQSTWGWFTSMSYLTSMEAWQALRETAFVSSPPATCTAYGCEPVCLPVNVLEWNSGFGIGFRIISGTVGANGNLVPDSSGNAILRFSKGCRAVFGDGSIHSPTGQGQSKVVVIDPLVTGTFTLVHRFYTNNVLTLELSTGAYSILPGFNSLLYFGHFEGVEFDYAEVGIVAATNAEFDFVSGIAITEV